MSHLGADEPTEPRLADPGPTTHPRDLPPCDLVMKGGVTSGVVYPRAVVELATRYRFENLGGTSAGAIAAAMSAALEFARQQCGAPELGSVDEIVRSFAEPGFFLSLFRPTPEARPLFDLMLRLTRGRGSRAKQSAAVTRTALAYRPWLAAISLLAAIVALVLLLAGFRHLALSLSVVLTVIVAIVVMLLAALTVAGPLVSLVRAVHRSLPRHGFGLCTGVAASAAEPPALTDWLHANIQACAGLPVDQPLTFAKLKQQGITLQMVATDVTLARPVTFPVTDEQYLFSPAELAAFFPSPVVDHVLRTAGVPDDERDSTRTWFLPADELPVVVGVRLSASVPVLLSSMTLYGAVAEAGAPIESFMADGAITSNFPIHFFDRWLPDHPTFGLDLVAAGPATPGHTTAPVYMPAGDDENGRLPPSRSIDGIGSFLGHVQDASRNWRDELQAQLPGSRDRICQIRLAPGEGGFHLDADPSAVEKLAQRGADAGREILQTFDWDRHRRGRYVTLIALLRENFSQLADSFAEDGGWLERVAESTDGDQIDAFDAATRRLVDQAAGLPTRGRQWATEPAPSMRIGPRV